MARRYPTGRRRVGRESRSILLVVQTNQPAIRVVDPLSVMTDTLRFERMVADPAQSARI
jgi:hypothetical protein